ncbi:MAG TPA: hypothetical protein VJ438_04140 [Candidatus Nanoarchaeia archaeon]|nr:hypothetical protein [Candidatus Nanoarchaeia archaeon]
MEVNILQKKGLTDKEKAYLLDKIVNTSYYFEQFGELDSKTEEKLIVSIFLKLQEN